MTASRPVRLQKSINYVIAQLELLSQSSKIELDQLTIVFETIAASGFHGEWPFREVFPLMSSIMADGISPESEKLLHEKLNSLFSNFGKPIGVPFADDEQITFSGKTFCFTGLFEFGNRKDCFAITEMLGGMPINSVRIGLNYLVVGKYCSPDWKHTKYGRKIERTIQLNSFKKHKHQIKIVSENLFVASALKLMKAS